MRMEKLSELPLDDLSMFIMQCIQNFLACFQGVKAAHDEQMKGYKKFILRPMPYR